MPEIHGHKIKRKIHIWNMEQELGYSLCSQNGADFCMYRHQFSLFYDELLPNQAKKHAYGWWSDACAMRYTVRKKEFELLLPALPVLPLNLCKLEKNMRIKGN